MSSTSHQMSNASATMAPAPLWTEPLPFSGLTVAMESMPQPGAQQTSSQSSKKRPRRDPAAKERSASPKRQRITFFGPPECPPDSEDEEEYRPSFNRSGSPVRRLDSELSRENSGSSVPSPAPSIDVKPDIKAPRKRKTPSARGQAAKAKGANVIPTLPRPELPQQLRMCGDKPPIWCETRQELCESLPYFKSYQGGHYTNGGRIWGCAYSVLLVLTHADLLDGYPSPLDAHSADLKVIISHGGGGSTEADAPEDDGNTSSASKTGPKQMSLSTSQSRSHFRIKALENACKRRIPVALIAGVNFEGTPWLKHLGARYAHYLVTHVYAVPELSKKRTGGVTTLTRFMARFEWVESQGSPWWFDLRYSLPRILAEQALVAQDALSQSQMPISPSLSPDAITAALQRTEAFVEPTSQPQPIAKHTCALCGHVSPVAYQSGPICLYESCLNFGRKGDYLFSTSDLQYLPSFLDARSVDTSKLHVDHHLQPWTIDEACLRPETYDRVSMLGTHCRDCGRLNAREEWAARACRSEQCRITSRRPVQHRILTAGELAPAFRTPPEYVSTVQMDNLELGEGVRCSVFELPDPNAQPASVAGQVIHIQFDDPKHRQTVDDMFASFQKDAVFVRGEMRQHRLQGRLLTQHFSLNSGEPYKYAARSPTVSFATSPDAVKGSLEFIREAAIKAMSAVSPSAPKPDFNEVLSIGYMCGQSMSWHDDGEQDVAPVVASLSFGSDATMDFRVKDNKALKKLRKEAGVPQPRASGPLGRTSLRVILKHGDILVMAGERFQQLFDHCVTPHGFRFASTARYIDPQRKTAEPRRKSAPTPAPMPSVSKPVAHRRTSSFAQQLVDAPSPAPQPRIMSLPPLRPAPPPQPLQHMIEPQAISQPHERHLFRPSLPPFSQPGPYAAEPSPASAQSSPMLPPPLPSPRGPVQQLYSKTDLPTMPTQTPEWARGPTSADLRQSTVTLPSPRFFASPTAPSIFHAPPRSGSDRSVRAELGFGTPALPQRRSV